jgi:hypothetical protein
MKRHLVLRPRTAQKSKSNCILFMIEIELPQVEAFEFH